MGKELVAINRYLDNSIIRNSHFSSDKLHKFVEDKTYSMYDTQNAVIVMHCDDKKGILSDVTDFILDNNGNILKLDQHVDQDENRFFMRVEWGLEGFGIPKEKVREYFKTLIADKYNANWSLLVGGRKQRMALFVSKYTHCFYDVLARYESGEWKVEIPLIISNHDKVKNIAERYNIPFYHMPITKATKGQQEEKELALLEKYKIDFVVLARYMQILSDDFVSHYPNKIINIHHSSLPAFAGADPYGSAHRRGVKFMGATGHYVTADLDEGPIISQDVVPISHRDSIKDMKRKGRDIEKVVFAKAIWAHLNHNVLTFKNKTVVFQS